MCIPLPPPLQKKEKIRGKGRKKIREGRLETSADEFSSSMGANTSCALHSADTTKMSSATDRLGEENALVVRRHHYCLNWSWGSCSAREERRHAACPYRLSI
jgi:hypothetical protein